MLSPAHVVTSTFAVVRQDGIEIREREFPTQVLVNGFRAKGSRQFSFANQAADSFRKRNLNSYVPLFPKNREAPVVAGASH